MQSSTISVCGSRIRVIEAGTGDHAVLFVHGLGGWAENWHEVLPAIAASGRRAIAFDLPGFGDSTPVRRPRYFDPRGAYYADVVDGVRSALGLERPHLVGHSLGGAIAYVAAVSHPESFSSLTLVAPGGLGPEIARSLRLASVPLLPYLVRLVRPRELSRAALESCFHDPERIPDHLLSELGRYHVRYRETLRVLRTVATARGVKRSLRNGWIPRAARFTAPVLVIWGRQDGVVPPTQARVLGAVFPNAELRFIERAGHLVMAERPDEFAALLIPFLERAEHTIEATPTIEAGVGHQDR